MTRKYVSPEKYERWQLMAFKKASFSKWDADKRAEGRSPRDRVEEFADMLRPVLLFLAKGAGHNPKFTRGAAIGTLHMRAWVLLYAVRPDLINGETMRAAAKRFGVTPIRVGDIMREFRACVPGFDPGIEDRRHFSADPQASAESHRQSMLRIWAERKRRASL